MAKGSRKGLPTKKKMVSRVSKSGKFSTYTQGYHLNPFKKTTQSKGKKQQDTGTGLSKSDQVVDKMKTLPAIDKRASMEGTLQPVSPNEPVGAYKTAQVTSKLKSTADVQTLSNNYLKSSLPTLNGKSAEMSTRINEHSQMYNSVPNTSEAYDIVVSDLVSSKDSMSESAFSSVLYSLNDHNLLEQVLSTPSKSEAYDREELLHDQHVKYSNPMGQVINYYTNDLSDNLKSTVIDLQQKQNDLKFVKNGVKLTDRERQVNQKWIDFNNDEATKTVSAGLLRNTVFVKIENHLSAEISKGDIDVTFNLYNSVIYEFQDDIADLKSEIQTHLSDVKAINDTNFTLHNCSFQLHKPSNEAYLIAKISVKNISEYNFISTAQEDADNFISNYNKYLLGSMDTSKLSEIEIKNKLTELTNSFTSMKENDHSYLLIEG